MTDLIDLFKNRFSRILMKYSSKCHLEKPKHHQTFLLYRVATDFEICFCFTVELNTALQSCP